MTTNRYSSARMGFASVTARRLRLPLQRVVFVAPRLAEGFNPARGGGNFI